jgi:positive regulator of sigma E activity
MSRSISKFPKKFFEIPKFNPFLLGTANRQRERGKGGKRGRGPLVRLWIILGTMECRGVVTERGSGWVKVRVAASDCAQCGACGIFSRRAGAEVEFTALDGTGVREGEEVGLEIPGRAVILSFLLAFGLPLLAMAAAYLLAFLLFLAAGGKANQGAAIGAAVAAGGACFWFSVRLAGSKLVHPRVTSVIRETLIGGKDGGEGSGQPYPGEPGTAGEMAIRPAPPGEGQPPCTGKRGG